MVEILLFRSDGGVSKMRFPHGQPDEAEVAAHVAKWEQTAGLQTVSRRRLEPGELPGREFRDAWRHANGTVAVDMAQARRIHRDRMRAAVKRERQALAQEYAEAVLDDDEPRKAQIKAQRRRLADHEEPDLERFETPSELHGHWPAELGARL